MNANDQRIDLPVPSFAGQRYRVRAPRITGTRVLIPRGEGVAIVMHAGEELTFTAVDVRETSTEPPELQWLVRP